MLALIAGRVYKCSMGEMPNQEHLPEAPPLSLHPDDIHAHIAECTYGTAGNSLVIGIAAGAEFTQFLPRFIQAVHDVDVVRMGYAVPSAMMGGLTVWACINLRDYTRKRRRTDINRTIVSIPMPPDEET